MLQPEVLVVEGLKIGDIDARCDPEHCITISDKARSVGGGVLEAVSLFAPDLSQVCSRASRSRGSQTVRRRQVAEVYQGMPLYQHTLKKLEAFSSLPRVVVTARKFSQKRHQ